MPRMLKSAGVAVKPEVDETGKSPGHFMVIDGPLPGPASPTAGYPPYRLRIFSFAG